MHNQLINGPQNAMFILSRIGAPHEDAPFEWAPETNARSVAPPSFPVQDTFIRNANDSD